MNKREMPYTCARCGEAFPSEATASCWYCGADLCPECVDIEGHCGHPEARAIDERSAQTDDESRRQIAKEISERSGRKPN